jgi:hypothetical protein
MLSKRENIDDNWPVIRYGDFEKFRQVVFQDPNSAYFLRIYLPPRNVCNQIDEERNGCKCLAGIEVVRSCESITISCVAVFYDGSEYLEMEIPIIIDKFPARNIEKIIITDITWKYVFHGPTKQLNRKTILKFIHHVNDELRDNWKKISRRKPKRAEGWTLKTCPVCFRRFEQYRPDQKVCRCMACRRAMSRHPRRVWHNWERKQEWYIFARSGQSILKKPY